MKPADPEMVALHDAYDKHDIRFHPDLMVSTYYGYALCRCHCGQPMLWRADCNVATPVTRDQAAGFLRAIRHWQRRHDKDDYETFRETQTKYIHWLPQWEVENLRRHGEHVL